MIRKPAVAGYFYPEKREELAEMIGDFKSQSAGEIPICRAKGAVLPHAGYKYSGLVAAKTVFASEFPRTFIILSPNHTGLGEAFSIMPQGIWQTPLGQVHIDEHLGKQILQNSHYLKDDPLAHQREHGVEVLLPFLQYVDPDFQFVPIVVAHASGDVYQKIAGEITGVLDSYRGDREISVVASSDMTHFEPKESAEKKDRYAIEAMCALDSENLLKKVREYDISMCGVGPAVIMMEVLKKFGARRSQLIDYRTSGQVTGDYASVVGYAGLRVE